jgi:hypothetical protein
MAAAPLANCTRQMSFLSEVSFQGLLRVGISWSWSLEKNVKKNERKYQGLNPYRYLALSGRWKCYEFQNSLFGLDNKFS